MPPVSRLRSQLRNDRTRENTSGNIENNNMRVTLGNQESQPGALVSDMPPILGRLVSPAASGNTAWRIGCLHGHLAPVKMR